MAAVRWCELTARSKYLKELGDAEVINSPADQTQIHVSQQELTSAELVATAWSYRALAPIFDVSTWTIVTPATLPVEIEDICLEYGASFIWHWRDLRARSNPREGIVPLHVSLAQHAKERLIEMMTSTFLLTNDGTIIQPKLGAGKTMPVVLGSFTGEPIFPSNTLEGMRDARYNEIKWKW
jgi:hypothetical protein